MTAHMRTIMTDEHKNRFNEQAWIYSTVRCEGRAQCIDKVLELLDPKPEDIILDLGCGPGAQLIELSRTIQYGYGIDLAENMIERAKNESAGFKNVYFSVGRVQNIPDFIFTAGINKVFSNYAFHHLSEKEKQNAILRIADLLPTGGLFVLGDLMFSENPDDHQDLFDFAGYGPGCDTPSYVHAIGEMFTSAGLKHRTSILNPLIGIVTGTKI